MEIIFYQKTSPENNHVISNEIYPMYHLNISETYLEGDKATVLKIAIKDLKQELEKIIF